MIKRILTAVLFLAPMPVLAQDAPKPLVLSVANQTARADTSRDQSDKPRPGDILRYTIEFTNHENRPIGSIRLSGRIPPGTTFVPQSAKIASATIVPQYSIDQGVTFSTTPMEPVITDGRTHMVPASPSKYTNIRWMVTEFIKPHASIKATYDVRLNPPSSPRSLTTTVTTVNTP